MHTEQGGLPGGHDGGRKFTQRMPGGRVLANPIDLTNRPQLTWRQEIKQDINACSVLAGNVTVAVLSSLILQARLRKAKFSRTDDAHIASYGMYFFVWDVFHLIGITFKLHHIHYKECCLIFNDY
jgi:hypothetical protein